MPRSVTETRDAILQAAFRQFRRKGFFRSGIDEIAEASHVTKRTLYNHFSSKDDLLAAVLAAQHERVFMTSDPFGVGRTENAGAFIDALFQELVVWSSKPKWAGSGFTRLAVELADLPGHPARSIARQHKAAIENHLSAVLATAGIEHSREAARELMLLIEGAMLMIMVHNDRSYAVAASTAAKRLLLHAPAATVSVVEDSTNETT
jgi:AcrR family transcriptional regulator